MMTTRMNQQRWVDKQKDNFKKSIQCGNKNTLPLNCFGETITDDSLSLIDSVPKFKKIKYKKNEKTKEELLIKKKLDKELILKKITKKREKQQRIKALTELLLSSLFTFRSNKCKKNDENNKKKIKKEKKHKISNICSWHNDVVIEEINNTDKIDDIIQKKLAENNSDKEIKKVVIKSKSIKKRKNKKKLNKGISISKENRITIQEYEALKDKHYPIQEIKKPYILIQPYYSETKRWELYLKDNLGWGLWKKGKSLHGIIVEYLKAIEKRDKISNPKFIINPKINKPIPKHRMSNLHYLETHC